MNILYITPTTYLIEDLAEEAASFFPLKREMLIQYPPEFTTLKPVQLREQFYKNYFETVQAYNPDCIMVSDVKLLRALVPDKAVKLGEVYPLRNLGTCVTLIPSEGEVFRRPDRAREDMAIAVNAVEEYAVHDNKSVKNKSFIWSAQYPKEPEEIQDILNKLIDAPVLACDIETWSLKHYDSGLRSICLCTSEHTGTAFRVDKYRDTPDVEVRSMLREFFVNYKGTLLFHNMTFDVYVLIYQLFMDSLTDYEGMLKGLEVFSNYHDTMIVAYLAINSCSGNDLSLKKLSQVYTGNYALENIKDPDSVPDKEFLEYNLIDGLATWFVYNSYFPKLVADEQSRVYEEVLLPAVKDIIQMQLTGMPLNMDRVNVAEAKLQADLLSSQMKILKSEPVKKYTAALKQRWADSKNRKLKNKRVTAADCKEQFNPASGKQLRELIYSQLRLPVIDTTLTGQPSTGKDTLEKLLNTETMEPEVRELLTSLIEYKDAVKILDTFIPAFKQAVDAGDGTHRLFGSYHIGGTVSGRLSSSNPNLQNLPATGSKYAKLIKSCFTAPPGYLMCGLDFSSLEDRISAVTTKDEEKRKIYRDGYDSHSYRAYNYFRDQMPDITEELEKVRGLEKVIKVTFDNGSSRYFAPDDPEFLKYRDSFL